MVVAYPVLDRPRAATQMLFSASCLAERSKMPSSVRTRLKAFIVRVTAPSRTFGGQLFVKVRVVYFTLSQIRVADP
jgi:hypothetical protein